MPGQNLNFVKKQNGTIPNSPIQNSPLPPKTLENDAINQTTDKESDKSPSPILLKPKELFSRNNDEFKMMFVSMSTKSNLKKKGDQKNNCDLPLEKIASPEKPVR